MTLFITVKTCFLFFKVTTIIIPQYSKVTTKHYIVDLNQYLIFILLS